MLLHAFFGSCFLRKWFEDFAVPGTCGWVRHGSFILRHRKQMSTGSVPSGCKMHLCNEKLQLQFEKLHLQFFGKLQLQFLGNRQNPSKITLLRSCSGKLQLQFSKNCSCSLKNCNCSLHKCICWSQVDVTVLDLFMIRSRCREY